MLKADKYFLLLCVFYLIAHGGILLIPNAIYWDDWVLYRTAPEIIIDTFRQQSAAIFALEGYMHVALLELGPWIYKVLTFILMFVTGMLLNSILQRHTKISAEVRFFIVLLFLILPFNFARVALIDFRYTFCYFLFFLAWQMMDRFRIMSLTLFFISFSMGSLLVFYAVPVFDAMYRRGYLSSLKSLLKFGVQRIDYILLPFVYFFIKIYFFSPSGYYEGYNEGYDIKHLFPAAVSQIYDVYHFLLWNLDAELLLWLLCMSLLSYILITTKSVSSIDTNGASWQLPVIGILVFLFGVFPYWILGYVPTFNFWTSRFQILMPLGVALLIVGALMLRNFRGKMGILSIIIGASLAFNTASYAALFIDWQKQKQLIYLFANSSDIQRSGLIIIEDKTRHLNGLSRAYRFYEWNGILEAAFGDEIRFGVPRSQLDDYLSGNFDTAFSGHYKAKSFSKDSDLPWASVEINTVKPEKLREKIMNVVFPKFTLLVSEANRVNSRNDGNSGDKL